jgi:hypothetical protein
MAQRGSFPRQLLLAVQHSFGSDDLEWHIMADNGKENPKPGGPKGKDKRITEPFMNFELPEEPTTPAANPEEDVIESAEILEEEIPVVGEAASEETLMPVEEAAVEELDEDAVEIVDDADVVEAVEDEPQTVAEEAVEVVDEEPLVVGEDAVEVVEEEPHIAGEEAVEVIDEQPTVEAEEAVESVGEVPHADSEDAVEVIEALPSSSKVIDAPLVEEVTESGIDLTRERPDEASKSEKKAVAESEIDLNALLDEIDESSAVDLGAVGKPTSVPISPVPEELHALDEEEPKDATEVVESLAEEEPVPVSSGKKGRERELVGVGGESRKRGGFVPFVLGAFLMAILAGGGGAAAWYFNQLPESPTAEKKQVTSAKLIAPIPGSVKDDSANKQLKAAQQEMDTLKAQAAQETENLKQLQQEYDALKTVLADANIPPEPEKLRAFMADLSAKKRPAEKIEPIAKGEGLKDEEAKKFKELIGSHDALVKEHEELQKKHEQLSKDHEAVLAKEPDAADKARAGIVKERDEAVKKVQVLAKERDDAVKSAESLVRERDDAAKIAESMAKERDESLKNNESMAKERDEAVKSRDADVKTREVLNNAIEAALSELKEANLLGNDPDRTKLLVESVKNARVAAQSASKGSPGDFSVKTLPVEIPLKKRVDEVAKVPAVATEPNPLLAEKHFSKGLDYFWGRRYSEAELEFVKTVLYYDDDARYRYFLGLSRYLQGTSDKRALSGADFEKGAQLERMRHPSAREVNASLERVQGQLRKVIDHYRAGGTP